MKDIEISKEELTHFLNICELVKKAAPSLPVGHPLKDDEFLEEITRSPAIWRMPEGSSASLMISVTEVQRVQGLLQHIMMNVGDQRGHAILGDMSFLGRLNQLINGLDGSIWEGRIFSSDPSLN